jgi:RNA polymerase sigma-70 factor (ECF subfamily)
MTDLGAPMLSSTDATFIHDLYQKTGRAAVAKTAAIVGSRAVAEEIVHDVYARLLERHVAFPTATAAYVWIYRSCHNAAIDHLRTGAARFEPQGLESAGDPAVDDDAVVVHNRQLLQRVAARLSPQEAALVAYLHLDGMTQDEAAEMLGQSRRTVVRMLKRIDERLGALKGEIDGRFSAQTART